MHYSGSQVLSPLYFHRWGQRFNRPTVPDYLQDGGPVWVPGNLMIKIGALQRNRTPHLRRVTLSATACLGLMFCAAALPATAVAAAAVPVPPAETTHIVAVVNGDVI